MEHRAHYGEAAVKRLTILLLLMNLGCAAQTWRGGTLRGGTIGSHGATPKPLLVCANCSQGQIAAPSTAVGSTSSTQTATILNSGSVTANISSCAFVTGTQFAITGGTLGSTLASGATGTKTFTFSPASAGTKTDILQCASDDPNSPLQITVTGLGTGEGLVSLSPTSVQFGSVGTGQRLSSSVTLTNTGNVPLTVSALAYTTGTDFTYDSQCATVAAGGQCLISVACAPTTTGALTDTLTITSDASNSPNTISVSCTGISSNAAFSIGEIPAFRYYRLTSTGPDANGNPYASAAEINIKDATGNSYTRSGWAVAVSDQETVGSNTPGTNAIDGSTATFWHSCWLTGASSLCSGQVVTQPPHWIRFDLGSTQTASGASYLARQDGNTHGYILNYQWDGSNDASTWTTLLTGTNDYTGFLGGTPPPVFNYSFANLSPTQANFGTQQVSSTSAAQIFPVGNSGSASATTVAVAVTGDFAQTNNCPATLPVGQFCQVSVTFTPTAAGTRQGSLSISADNASTATLPLTGTGSSATRTSITVSPSSASTTVGGTASFTATDNLGANVTSQCTWDTSNHSIATMSGATATGIASGAANVTCTISAIVGTASLTVSSGTGILLTENFETCAFCSLPSGWVEDGNRKAGTGRVASGSTPAGCFEGSWCLDVHIPSGSCGDNFYQLEGTSGTVLWSFSQQIWVRYYVYFPSTFEWTGGTGCSGSGAMKLNYFKSNSSPPQSVYFEARSASETGVSTSGKWYISSDAGDPATYTGASVTRGVWHEVKIHIDKAHSTFTYFIDGTQVSNGPISDPIYSAGSGVSVWNIGSYFNSPAPQTEDFYIDKVALATADPGD